MSKCGTHLFIVVQAVMTTYKFTYTKFHIETTVKQQLSIALIWTFDDYILTHIQLYYQNIVDVKQHLLTEAKSLPDLAHILF